jgi:hypothetical protein
MVVPTALASATLKVNLTLLMMEDLPGRIHSMRMIAVYTEGG